MEYLVPALDLTAISCVLHGFISNEGEFRLAVSKILKGNHIVRIVHGLMFYSILRRLNLVSLRVGKVHGGNDLLVQNNLVVFTSIPELLPIRRLHAAEKFPPTRKSIWQTGAVKPFGPHHCITYFGSVHAFQTSSRGASKTLVTTIRSISLTVFSVISDLLFLH